MKKLFFNFVAQLMSYQFFVSISKTKNFKKVLNKTVYSTILSACNSDILSSDVEINILYLFTFYTLILS